MTASPSPVQQQITALLATGAKFSPTFDESRRYFEARLGVSLPARKEVSAKCPWHDDKTASMSINLEKGTWFCHACNIGGGLLDFERKLTDKDDQECWAAINATIGRDASLARKSKSGERRIAATYDYHDAAGKVVFQAVRYEPKGFSQRRPDGRGGWIPNMDGVTRVLFNLPAVVMANVALISEGEKDALNLQRAAADFPHENGTLRYAATCNVGGAGKWLDDYSPYVAGKRVFAFQDNDKAGCEHMQQVCASVATFAQGVQLVELPGLRDKGDVSDYLETHTPTELFKLMKAAPVWTPPAAPNAANPSIEVGQVVSYPSVASGDYVADTQAWPTLPAAALHGLAGDVVRTIEPHSEADPAAILIQILVAMGNMIGKGLHCIVESTVHALVLFAVLVGETSKGRKGTSWGHVERLCTRVSFRAA